MATSLAKTRRIAVGNCARQPAYPGRLPLVHGGVRVGNYSAIVRLLLARHWKAQATSLFEIARQDPSFFDFVLVRVHAPEPWEEDGQRVARLAFKACPGRAQALCARLAKEAESASQKPAEE